MDIVQLFNKSKLKLKQDLNILKILLLCNPDEDKENQLLFIERIYETLEEKVTIYLETNNSVDYNILNNDYHSVVEMIEELKDDLIPQYKIASIVMLNNMKDEELASFYHVLGEVLSPYHNILQASSDIFYHSGKELSIFIMQLIHYIQNHDIPNLKLIPLSVLEENTSIITLSFKDWILLFKNIRLTMKYLNSCTDMAMSKLKKEFEKLNVYYFIVITGGEN